MTLLDETVGQAAAPFYIGIFQIFLVVGPALGNVIEGQFLEIYVDFERAATPDLGSDDPEWIGAWWIGFIVGGLFSWLCALFIFCYPPKIPKKIIPQIKPDLTMESEAQSSIKPSFTRNSRTRLSMQISRFSTIECRTLDKDSLSNLTGVIKKILQLLKNPTYMLLCIGGGLDGIVISGLVFFLPKFILSQFGGTPSGASILMGMVVVPAGGLGTFFGGYLVKRFHMSRENILKMYIYCQLITIPCSMGFMFHCQNVPFAGINSGYNNLNTASDEFSLSSSCNSRCGYKNGVLCGGKEIDSYAPVCGSDQTLYFNPCYAGCTSVTSTTICDEDSESCKLEQMFTDCRCLETAINASTVSVSTNIKPCTFECMLEKYAFMACLFVTIWFTMMSAMPCVACILRFVEPENKSMSMGIANIIVR